MPAGKRETVIEQNSFSGSVSPTYKMGETAYSKFFDNTSGKWERWSGSGAPTVASRLQIHSGSDYADIGYSGSDLSIPVTVIAGDIEFGTIAITGSTVTFPVTGSMDARQSGSWNVDARQSGSWGVGVTEDIGKSITGSIGLSVTGSTIVGDIGKSITGSIALTVSNLRVTGSLTTTLYSAFNFALGATGSTGSGNFNVSQYSGKSAYAYLHTATTSGSLIVSGSFDGTNYFQFRSGSFVNGSLQWFTFFDAVPNISVNLFNQVTGSAISGSLYLVAQA